MSALENQTSGSLTAFLTICSKRLASLLLVAAVTASAFVAVPQAKAQDDLALSCKRHVEDGETVPGYVEVEGKVYKLLSEFRYRELTLRLSELKELQESVALKEEKMRLYEEDIRRKDAYIDFLHETLESDRAMYLTLINSSVAKGKQAQGFVGNTVSSPYFNFVLGFGLGIAGRVVEDRLREGTLFQRR